ncbi:MAG: hypothetical protein KatS3mg060_2870 [Dehalococcoidia bacterium]|nr:MAG: hypothetical protein KatS3mg060_2870 [Dehalococcoidia bacterium]
MRSRRSAIDRLVLALGVCLSSVFINGSELASHAATVASTRVVARQSPSEHSGSLPAAPEVNSQANAGFSLRFFGTGTGQVDRVTVRIDGEGAPANVSDDFTIELWLKAQRGDNASGPCETGPDAWTRGNIVVDRDVFGPGDFGDFGVSLFGGVIAFGVAVGSNGVSLCGVSSVDDGAWHHVAVTRRAGDGRLQIFVDGRLEASGTGPLGSVAYRRGRATSWPNDPYLVLGAEKHDYDPRSYPSFRGWIDDLRISTTVRYAAAFPRPGTPAAADAATALLFRFDEGPEGPCTGALVDSAPGGQSPGVCSFGGALGGGPRYARDTPFSTADAPARVVSVRRATAQTVAQSPLRFEVAFSAPVEQVDPADFVPTVLSGAFATLQVTEVTGAGALYTVTVQAEGGAGVVRLDLPTSATVVDQGGRPVVGLPFTDGETYLIPSVRVFLPSTLMSRASLPG